MSQLNNNKIEDSSLFSGVIAKGQASGEKLAFLGFFESDEEKAERLLEERDEINKEMKEELRKFSERLKENREEIKAIEPRIKKRLIW